MDKYNKEQYVKLSEFYTEIGNIYWALSQDDGTSAEPVSKLIQLTKMNETMRLKSVEDKKDIRKELLEQIKTEVIV